MTELLLGHQEAQRSEYLKEQQPVTLMCTRMEWSRHEAGGGGVCGVQCHLVQSVSVLGACLIVCTNYTLKTF